MKVAFNVRTTTVAANATVRHVVSAKIPPPAPVAVIRVPLARGPQGKQGDQGPPGTIGGDTPVIITGGFF